MSEQPRTKEALEGTGRLEAFSDGVIAIIVTILILELKVPEIHDQTLGGSLHALLPLLPKLGGFLVSFVTVAIFWVNHHHFFHALKKSNGALLWYNNHLLFWLAVVPFATALVGDYPQLPLVVSLYGLVLCLAALAFSLMIRYVFFCSNLLDADIPSNVRRSRYRRSWLGVACYGLSALLAFVHPYLSFAIFVIVPVYYFLPQSIQE